MEEVFEGNLSDATFEGSKEIEEVPLVKRKVSKQKEKASIERKLMLSLRSCFLERKFNGIGGVGKLIV
ncbi:hypothetical protein F0562_022522 [Nyssa sinensis]|uniref:Uncharacterized protein n=1 Tax=Nyssa sinensis TaxID=561372 RepID=A0A5J5BNS4_9ASTE|nr:hypothetical protein F0562_022522 [Nyssa sinensis]